MGVTKIPGSSRVSQREASRIRFARGLPMLWHVVAIALLALLNRPKASAQEGKYSLPTEKHARELAITTGFAADLPGGARGGDYWTAQFRMGRTLLAPRVLRGALEAALEVEPAMILRQDGFIYGFGFTPLLLQWNINTGSHLTPYINIGAGILATTGKFPRDTTQLNFTPQGGVGAYWFTSPTQAWVMGLRFHHTSNSGLAELNPGHNALYIHAGFSWWR